MWMQVGEVEGMGLDLIGLVANGGEGLLDSLDGEVRADVEAAARLLAARGLPPAQDPVRWAGRLLETATSSSQPLSVTIGAIRARRSFEEWVGRRPCHPKPCWI